MRPESGVKRFATMKMDHPPDPAALAKAVDQVAAELPRFSRQARLRAVDRFDVRPWLDRHEVIFSDLLRQKNTSRVRIEEGMEKRFIVNWLEKGDTVGQYQKYCLMESVDCDVIILGLVDCLSEVTLSRLLAYSFNLKKTSRSEQCRWKTMSSEPGVTVLMPFIMVPVMCERRLKAFCGRAGGILNCLS